MIKYKIFFIHHGIHGDIRIARSSSKHIAPLSTNIHWCFSSMGFVLLHNFNDIFPQTQMIFYHLFQWDFSPYFNEIFPQSQSDFYTTFFPLFKRIVDWDTPIRICNITQFPPFSSIDNISKCIYFAMIWNNVQNNHFFHIS